MCGCTIYEPDGDTSIRWNDQAGAYVWRAGDPILFCGEETAA